MSGQVDPVTYTLSEQRLSEWRRELCEAVEKLQAVTRHVGYEGAGVAERVLLDLIVEAECSVAHADEGMRVFMERYPNE